MQEPLFENKLSPQESEIILRSLAGAGIPHYDCCHSDEIEAKGCVVKHGLFGSDEVVLLVSVIRCHSVAENPSPDHTNQDRHKGDEPQSIPKIRLVPDVQEVKDQSAEDCWANADQQERLSVGRSLTHLG